MSSPRTRTANQARLVPCSTGCRTNVWLAGGLPNTADLAFVCDRCAAARKEAYTKRELAAATADAPCPAVDEASGAACAMQGEHGRHSNTDPDCEIQWVDRTEATS